MSEDLCSEERSTLRRQLDKTIADCIMSLNERGVGLTRDIGRVWNDMPDEREPEISIKEQAEEQKMQIGGMDCNQVYKLIEKHARHGLSELEDSITIENIVDGFKHIRDLFSGTKSRMLKIGSQFPNMELAMREINPILQNYAENVEPVYRQIALFSPAYLRKQKESKDKRIHELKKKLRIDKLDSNFIIDPDKCSEYNSDKVKLMECMEAQKRKSENHYKNQILSPEVERFILAWEAGIIAKVLAEHKKEMDEILGKESRELSPHEHPDDLYVNCLRWMITTAIGQIYIKEFLQAHTTYLQQTDNDHDAYLRATQDTSFYAEKMEGIQRAEIEELNQIAPEYGVSANVTEADKFRYSVFQFLFEKNKEGTEIHEKGQDYPKLGRIRGLLNKIPDLPENELYKIVDEFSIPIKDDLGCD